MPPIDMRLLEIYLDDHWAGAGAGRSLAARLVENNRDTQWEDRLSWVLGEIEEDDETLGQVRAALGFEGGTAKRTLARAAERVSRLKPNGRLISYSPLSRLLECEALGAGVLGKRRLWSALHDGLGDSTELSEFDFEDLIRRADHQMEVLSDFHSHAASLAFRQGADLVR